MERDPRIKSAGCARSSLLDLSFAGLVVIARSPYPIPSRTRPSNSSAPMVLSLKTWESRSLPGLRRTASPRHDRLEQDYVQRRRRLSLSAHELPSSVSRGVEQ